VTSARTNKWPRPVVVVSQCLGFAAVRYNGLMLEDDFVAALGRYVRFVQVCPEVGIGLGVPRDPIRIVDTGSRRLVQPSTGRDLTESMRAFAAEWLNGVGQVDGFILKARSPSCGIRDVKTFPSIDTETPAAMGFGFFAEEVLRRFPEAAIADECQLKETDTRHQFLTRLFARACARLGAGTLSELYPAELNEAPKRAERSV
jgi:uncharacterized protein YbbK (DUF523 family)